MDINTLAKSITDQATGDAPIVRPKAKSVAAVKRGQVRNEAIGPERASRLAREAANKRWHGAENGVKIDAGE